MKPGSVEGKRVKLSIRYRENVFEFRLFCFLLFLVHQPLSTDTPPLPLKLVGLSPMVISQKTTFCSFLYPDLLLFARQQFYQRFIPIHASLK